MKTFPMLDFSGGWNPRDAWSQVADNESPDMLNVTLDERGGIAKRLGLTKTGVQADGIGNGNVQSLYYSAALDRLLAQIGANVYSSSNGGSTWSASIKTFTTSERCHMVDFVGKVVFIHPTDKAFSWDGSAFSAPLANSPKGTCIAVWQNALWSVGDPTAGQTVRVTRSDLGAITWPGSPVTVDIRAKDDQPLTCVGGGTGMDILGRDGLLVWKENSYYRINDAATGEYTVENFNYGASGPQAVTTNEGVTCAISRRGIIATSGSGTPGEVISSKIEPLFRPNQISFAQGNLMCAGNFENRIVFSLPWDGAVINNMTLEYSPQQGWIVPHNFGLASMTSYTKNTNKLLGGKQGDNIPANFGYVLDVFTGGSDDGQPISARHEIRWFEPNKGNTCRFRRLVVNGRGTFQLYFKVNYDASLGELFPIDISGDTSVWGTAVWGVDLWASDIFQDYAQVFSLGYGRSFSIEIQETSSLSGTGPNLLDVGASRSRGAFAVYGYNLDIQPLGNN